MSKTESTTKKKPTKNPGAETRSPEEIQAHRIHVLLTKLADKAAEGNQKAKEELYWLRWICFGELKKELEQNAKAGTECSPPPIRTILEMADFSIPLLLWLSEHRRENIKKYARDRWAWPAYVHLSKRAQGRYESLLPKFNKTGTKITEPSPIDLGADLRLNINANLTSGDWLFVLAAHVIRCVTDIEEGRKFYFGRPWNWLEVCHKPLAGLLRKAHQEEAERFLSSRLKFTRPNWVNWKPILDAYITLHYGPPEERFNLFPPRWKTNLYIANQYGTGKQWLELYRKTKVLTDADAMQFIKDMQFYESRAEPPLHHSTRPEIRKIVDRVKTEVGKWIELKDELLKRIRKLSPTE